MQMNKKIYIIPFLILASYSIYAQKIDNSFKYWITIGAWVDRDLTANFNYCFSIGNKFYKVNYLLKDQSFLANNLTPGSHGIVYRSIDASIGKRLQSEWFQTTFFIGPSYIFGKKKMNNLVNNFTAIGVQSDIQLLFRIANEIGLGLDLFANLNFERSFAGFDVNITLGNGK